MRRRFSAHWLSIYNNIIFSQNLARNPFLVPFIQNHHNFNFFIYLYHSNCQKKAIYSLKRIICIINIMSTNTCFSSYSRTNIWSIKTIMVVWTILHRFYKQRRMRQSTQWIPGDKSAKSRFIRTYPIINPIISNFKSSYKNSLVLYYHNALQNDTFLLENC